MTSQARCSLKDRPLRYPGQSLDEQIQDERSDLIAGPVLFALFMVLVTVMEWWRYYHPVAAAPIPYSLAALISVVYAGYRVVRACRESGRRSNCFKWFDNLTMTRIFNRCDH